MFDLLVAHYVRGEAQRKNIIGDYHRSGMDPERVKAVAMAAVQYLADSPKRPNDGRYPRQVVLFKHVSGETIGRLQQRIDEQGAPCMVSVGSQYLPPGTWEVVAIEMPDDDCPDTQRGTHG